jgi:hypothetical protein
LLRIRYRRSNGNWEGWDCSRSSNSIIALFTNVLTIRGEYKLAVEFENDTSLIVNVKPTPEIFKPAEKWNLCSIAIIEYRPPQ